MKKPMLKILFGLMAVFLSACSFNKQVPIDIKQWRLMPVRVAEPLQQQTNLWLTQGNITVVSPFDSKSWVFRVADGRFQKDFYNEYISTPSEMIASATRQWIDAAGIFQFVNPNSTSLFANYVLQGTVEELYVDIRREPKVVLRIVYLVSSNIDLQNPVVLRKTYNTTQAVVGEVSDEANILKAQEAALSSILGQLEVDLLNVSKSLKKPSLNQPNTKK